MATAVWRANSTLKTLVLKHYGRFNVFQLMRLLLWKRGQRAEQCVRFSADLSAAFPGNEISRLSVRDDEAIEVSTPNFCVASTLGPLPEPFTEWVRDLKRARDPVMEDFFNIFNQRMNVLRFQLKARQTPALNHLPPEETAHARYLASLMGMGQTELAAQMPLPRRAWLGIAGLLSNSRRSEFTVTHVLSLFLGAQVKLEQMVGAWQRIEPDNRIALGLRNHRLGQQSVLGRKVWDQQARVRLIVAPLDYDAFCMLLPPNEAERRMYEESGALDEPESVPTFHRFVALMRFLLDRQCDCEVRLQAIGHTVPPSRLTAMAKPRAGGYWGLRLGQTAWLGGASKHKAGYLVHAFDQKEAA